MDAGKRLRTRIRETRRAAGGSGEDRAPEPCAGSRLDLVFDWSAVAGAGYHVLQSVDPGFGSAVDLVGTTTTETSFTLEDGAHATPALTFFQVRAVNACHQEGP